MEGYVDGQIRVGLSTSCSYPESTTAAFEIASRLGYDGVEVMVWTDPVSQDGAALRRLVDHYGVPVLSIHAPTLLLLQRTWGRDTWAKLERSCELAAELGADTVVVGIQPDVALAMARLGTTLHPILTALDLEEGLALLDLTGSDRRW